MFVVKGRRGEIVVQRVHFKPIKGVNWRFRPLPYVAHYIVKITGLVNINRFTRRVLVQRNVIAV